MPTGFNDELFYKEFKLLFPNFWDDICAKHAEYKRMDEGLVKNGFKKRYFFPSPNTFLKTVSSKTISIIRINHKENTGDSVEAERTEFRSELLRQTQNKIAKKTEILDSNLKHVQELEPEYSNYFIDQYFNIKHNEPEDVSTRFIILLEASKYKCRETIKFLQKVNASERNFNLRHFAFLTLQKFGIKEVRLRKNRKGKKRVGDNLSPIKIESPADLLKHIYISQLEKEKTYDVFLSHSSLNKELILKLKSILNSLNLNIYVDWINDQEGLKRELTDVNTAEVIIERLKLCKALIFIYSEDSMKSLWAPWEIGYFHALKRKVGVFISDSVDENTLPAFINIYPKLVIQGGNIMIKEKKELTEFREWIDKKS